MINCRFNSAEILLEVRKDPVGWREDDCELAHPVNKPHD